MALVYDPVSGDSVGAQTGIVKQRRCTNRHRETVLVHEPASGNGAGPRTDIRNSSGVRTGIGCNQSAWDLGLDGGHSLIVGEI